jgi:hypothetical protein
MSSTHAVTPVFLGKAGRIYCASCPPERIEAVMRPSDCGTTADGAEDSCYRCGRELSRFPSMQVPIDDRWYESTPCKIF